MKPVIQSSLVLHARIVCMREDFIATTKNLPPHWRIMVSGPRPTGHHRFDGTRSEMLVERVVLSHEDQATLLMELATAIGADPET